MPKHHHNSRKRPKYYWCWTWCCCCCGRSGGMTVSIEQCPEYNCGHTRCAYCPVEAHKTRDGGGGGGYSSWTNPQANGSEGTPKHSSSSPLPTRTINDPVIAERATIAEIYHEQIPIRRHDSLLKALSPEPLQIEKLEIRENSLTASTSSSPSHWTDISEFVTDAFHDSKTTLESDTEVETMESDTTEEASDIEDAWPENDTTTMESLLLYVLSQDLDLAARVIPRVHALAHESIHSALTDAVPQDQEGADCSQNSLNSSSTITASNRPTPQRARSQKRRLNQNGRDEREESGDRGGGHGPKRRKPSPSRRNMPTFACHFFKFDPDKYSGCLKYRTCACPSVPHDRLSRIKDHFKTHKSRQCNRCYHDFEDIDQLMAHQRDPKPCNTRSPSLREGIDESQAERIDSILKTKRGTNPSERPNLERDKWFQIWRILFPNVKEPSNPYSQPKTSARTEPYDPESLMNRFAQNVNQYIRDGMLRSNDELPHYRNALRRALEEESNQFLEIPASESPESNFGDAANQGTAAFSNIARGTTIVNSILDTECPVSQSMNDAASHWAREHESRYGDSQHTRGIPPSPMTVRLPDLQTRSPANSLTASNYQALTQSRANLPTAQNTFLPDSLSSQATEPTTYFPSESLFEQNDVSMTEPFNFDQEFGFSTPTQSFNISTQEHGRRNINTSGVDSVPLDPDYDSNVDPLTALLASENDLPAATDPRYKTKYVGKHGLS